MSDGIWDGILEQKNDIGKIQGNLNKLWTLVHTKVSHFVH